jgi:hypothetical protein
VASYKVGEKTEVEALHAGDPTPPEPVKLTVTEESAPFGRSVSNCAPGRPDPPGSGPGFARQFITYAEQMQIARPAAARGCCWRVEAD